MQKKFDNPSRVHNHISNSLKCKCIGPFPAIFRFLCRLKGATTKRNIGVHGQPLLIFASYFLISTIHLRISLVISGTQTEGAENNIYELD